MITVIPAAGKSSRYFGNKPKWLRTLPEGQLMIEKAIEGLLGKSERTLLIITSQIETEFGVVQLMRQIFGSELEVIILPNSTNSAVETVIEGLKTAEVNLSSKLIIKDSDNIVDFAFPQFDESFSVGVDMSKHNVSNVASKSFFKLNEGSFITDFIEKKIVSHNVSVGTHGFTSVRSFLDYAAILFSNSPENTTEYYISNVVALMIYAGVRVKYIEALEYLDLGTQHEWEYIRKSRATYFIDYDGTLVKNAGKYGVNRWKDEDLPLRDNLVLLKKFFDNGAQIIITTSRPKEYEEKILALLKDWDITPYQVITGLNHSQRVLINDYADTNIFPSATALNVKRNVDLNEIFLI